MRVAFLPANKMLESRLLSKVTRPSLRLATASATPPSQTPSDLAWRVIGLLNLYRLLVPLVLLAIQSFAGVGWGLITERPRLFVGACIAYFTAAVLLVIARRLQWSSLRIVALVNAVVDALAIGLILYASGGVASGLAILVVLPVLTLTVLAGRRDALLIAAVAALAILGQQVFIGLTDAAPTTDYVTAGLFGGMVFLVALAMWPVANRLRESEALVRRREVDLANMAQLSQYIVQHLRESILVVDAQDRIRLINESAAQILGDEHAYPDALIGEAAPRLLFLLEAWRQNTGSVGGVLPADQTFVAADGATRCSSRPWPRWQSSDSRYSSALSMPPRPPTTSPRACSAAWFFSWPSPCGRSPTACARAKRWYGAAISTSPTWRSCRSTSFSTCARASS